MNGLKCRIFCLAFTICLAFSSCNDDDDQEPTLLLTALQIGNDSMLEGAVMNAAVHGPVIASFNLPVDTSSFSDAFFITDDQHTKLEIRYNFFNNNQSVSIYPLVPLAPYTEYILTFTELKSASGKSAFSGTDYQFRTIAGQLNLQSITAGTIDLTPNRKIYNVPLDLQVRAEFSAGLDEHSINNTSVYLKKGNKSIAIAPQLNGNILEINPVDPIDYWSTYTLVLDTSIQGIGAVGFEGFEATFFTALDSTLKFPELSDEELLTKVQQQTFKYFWDFAHPVSGLARERNTSGNLVTSGGSGFGLMAIIVGIERGFITREQGIQRLDKIVTFLGEKAQRFHGVWPHWLDGGTGAVIPFSNDDDGGDLVETAFMVQGLLTVRQYLDENDQEEALLISRINQLWEEVEWDWYTNGQDVLYWHWSPNYGWQKNHKISGWNEALIVYLLAAASPTHSISESVYHKGWARNGAMVNASGNSHYGYTLDLRSDRGGPLFFVHYSFLGLDPRNLNDQYANYWEQNVNHTRINRAYCIDNPKNHVGYGTHCWGLTASDNHEGYSAHSPNNDLGVITPTAAISSIPYTPEESLDALRYFYYILGDRLWGEYGFYDAFHATESWTASSYLAIDQGPIILMIENYRTGLLWELFMSAPEVQTGLNRLEFE